MVIIEHNVRVGGQFTYIGNSHEYREERGWIITKYNVVETYGLNTEGWEKWEAG